MGGVASTQMRPIFVRFSRSMDVPRSVLAATAYRSRVALDEDVLGPSSSIVSRVRWGCSSRILLSFVYRVR